MRSSCSCVAIRNPWILNDRTRQCAVCLSPRYPFETKWEATALCQMTFVSQRTLPILRTPIVYLLEGLSVFPWPLNTRNVNSARLAASQGSSEFWEPLVGMFSVCLFKALKMQKRLGNRSLVFLEKDIIQNATLAWMVAGVLFKFVLFELWDTSFQGSGGPSYRLGITEKLRTPHAPAISRTCAVDFPQLLLQRASLRCRNGWSVLVLWFQEGIAQG